MLELKHVKLEMHQWNFWKKNLLANSFNPGLSQIGSQKAVESLSSSEGDRLSSFNDEVFFILVLLHITFLPYLE
jgi:hypothetical protein